MRSPCGDVPFTVVQEQAFALLDPARFPLVTDYLRNSGFDKIGFEWSAYTKLSPTFKRNLRHLFSALDFAGRVEDAPLLEAVACLQDLLRRGQAPRQANPARLPTTVIPTSVSAADQTGPSLPSAPVTIATRPARSSGVMDKDVSAVRTGAWSPAVPLGSG